MALPKQVVQARREFRTSFSSTTAEIIKRIARGQDTHKIADAVGVTAV